MINPGHGNSDPFRAGLRVLIVDDDPTCLIILEKMFRTCLCNETGCNQRQPLQQQDTSSSKKPRVVWTFELHEKFVSAVEQLGIDKAVPKKILETMNVPGLTRENVASHLQKYRIYLRRTTQDQGNLNNSFMNPNSGPLSTLNGFDLQSQLQATSLGRMSISPLLDQRSIFNFENPKIRFEGGYKQTMNNGNKNMNLLPCVPMGMEPKQFAGGHMHAQQQISGVHVQSSRIQPVADPLFEGGTSLLPTNHSVFNNLPSKLPQNSFSLASAPGPTLQGINNSAATTAYGNPNYDLFNKYPQQQKQHNNDIPNDQDLQNMQLIFDYHQNAAASTNILAMADYGQNHQQMTPTAPTQYNHEDLLSTLLKQENIPLVDNEFEFDGYSIDNIPV